MGMLTGHEIERLTKTVTIGEVEAGTFVLKGGKPTMVVKKQACHDEYMVRFACPADEWQYDEWVPVGTKFDVCGPNGERIGITPFDPERCGANSYDVHLHDTESIQVYDLPGYVTDWRWVTQGILDPRNPPKKKPLEKHVAGPAADGWLLWPGRVHLASTREWTSTEALAPKLDGRSSVGRYGLFVHVTAGFGDDNFRGWWTLELVATEPVLVWPGMKIAQINYTTLVGERKKYEGRYQDQPATPTESRFHV